MIAGMDFGTTNSGMAVFDGGEVRLLPLDPAGTNPHVVRTALYLTNQQAVTIGRAALDDYLAHNTNRPARLQKVWVGEVEVIASEVYFVDDVYVWMDVLSPGRLFLSMKSGLRDASYAGTVTGHFFYTLEDLVALFLTVTRLRAEKLLGHPLRQVVLGRPVHFSLVPEEDRLAQNRLLAAAFHAGYEEVFLAPEPVAAAYSYQVNLERPQNVLVFDFGGGTLDITVARLGEGGLARVLATGGIPVAGDLFDRKLARARLPRYFGEGTHYGPRHKPLPVPAWIYDVFSDWQEMVTLQRPENLALLQEIERTARRPSEIKALRGLVAGNVGLQLFDEVERAKRALSQKVGAMIHLQGPAFNVYDLVTRSQFEQLIRQEIAAISQHLEETVAQSGLAPGQIEAVIRTGGSSQIPVFQQLLQEKFGPERVLAIDTFSSVTAGLGIMARAVEEGRLELPAYTAADLGEARAVAEHPRVPLANVAVLRRRLAAREGRDAGMAVGAASGLALLLLAPGERLLACPWTGEPLSLAQAGWGDGPPPRQALRLPLDDPLLLLTSRHRFLLPTPRDLLELQALGLGLRDLFYFQANEQPYALANWSGLKEQEKMVLVTSLGFARAYPVEALAESMEGPVPLQFDEPPPGWPLAVLGGGRGEALLLATDAGRGVRLPLGRLPNVGGEVLRRGGEEQVVAALVASGAEELVALTAAGYGRRLEGDWVAEGERLGTRGRALLARKGLVGLARVPASGRVWAVTERRLVPLEVGGLPLARSTATARLPGLGQGERLVALVGPW